MSDPRAEFLRVLEQACAASGDQKENVNNLQRLLGHPDSLTTALSVLEDPACDARAHTLSAFFVHEVHRRCMLRTTPHDQWPSIAPRLYALFARTLQKRCESDNEELKRDFEIFGVVFNLLARIMAAGSHDILLEHAAPGFQLIQSEKLSDVICGVQFLNIMIDGASDDLWARYLQAVGMLAERGFQNLPAFAPIFVEVFRGGLYPHYRWRSLRYLVESDGLILKILLNCVNLLLMAAQQRTTIENVEILEMIYEAAWLLNCLVCCINEREVVDAETERLLEAVRAQCMVPVVGAAVAVKHVVPQAYCRRLLSNLLYLIRIMSKDEVSEEGLPELCDAVLELCVLQEDDFQDHDVNPNRFYDTAYPDSWGRAGPLNPRRVARDFLQLLAKHHLSRVLEVLLSRPPQENVVFALRCVSKQVRKVGSPEHQHAVARYLRDIKERESPIPTCTWMSAISRYAYCEPQDILTELAARSLHLLCTFAPDQPNENTFFFTVGCDVIYHLMKFGFRPDRRYSEVIVRYAESTANGIGMRLLNDILQPSDQSGDVTEQLMASVQHAAESLYAQIDSLESCSYSEESGKILAIVDFLRDKTKTPIRLPTESLCMLFNEKFFSDESCLDLLRLACSLFRNQQTPDLYRILGQILSIAKDDDAGSLFIPFGAEMGAMFCSFITYQLRCPESVALVPDILTVVMSLMQSATFIEDLGPLPKVVAAIYQSGIGKYQWLKSIVGVISQSELSRSHRATCNLLILEILASASAFIPDVVMPPRHLAGLVKAISQGILSTNYLRHLCVLCLEKHRGSWPADLTPLDEILTAVKSGSIPLNRRFFEEHPEFYGNSCGDCIIDMPLSQRQPDPDFVIKDDELADDEQA